MKKVLMFSVAVMVSGCAMVQPKLVTNINPYNNLKTYTYHPVHVLYCHNMESFSNDVKLGFMGSDDIATIFVHYTAQNWAFIDPKSGMDLLIDGVAHKLTSSLPADREVSGGGFVDEKAYYLVNRAIVQKMANAKKVQFRVYSKKGYIEQCLGSEQTQSLSVVAPLIIQ